MIETHGPGAELWSSPSGLDDGVRHPGHVRADAVSTCGPRRSPPGSGRFAQHEQDATALRTFEHSLVPGLLQVPEYARALLSTRMGTSQDETEQLVAARMERQVILDRADPPLLWVVVDEHALRRPVGGRKVMAEQLDHLAEMAQRPSILIEVIPLDVGAHEGVNGAFVIAEFADAPSYRVPGDGTNGTRR